MLFLGCVGSVELAAVGVSASVFNLVSKLFNVPLLNITTSFVAEEQGLVGKAKDGSRQISDGNYFLCFRSYEIGLWYVCSDV